MNLIMCFTNGGKLYGVDFFGENMGLVKKGLSASG